MRGPDHGPEIMALIMALIRAASDQAAAPNHRAARRGRCVAQSQLQTARPRDSERPPNTAVREIPRPDAHRK